MNPALRDLILGTTPLPLTIPGLALWLDAADASTVTLDGSNNVELWADKSGNGRNFGQTDSLRRPGYSTAAVNGLNAVHFDGSDDILNRASSGQTWAFAYPLSIFVVFRAVAFSAAYNALWEFYTAANALNAGHTGLIKSTGQSAVYATSTTGTQPNYDGTGAITYATNSTNQFFVRLAATNDISSRGNQATDGSTSGTWTLRTNIGALALEIGASSKFSRFTQMRICEFVIYNAAISDGDRDKVEAYLKAKWGTP